MRILFLFIILCIHSCSSSKKTNSSGAQNGSNRQTKAKKKPVKLYVYSNIATDIIAGTAEKKITEKNITILNDAEFKELTNKQFKDAFRNAGGKDLQSWPEANKLNNSLNTTESYMSCFSLYCVIKETGNQTLVFDSLHYSQSKFPVPKNIERINFDLTNFPDKSLLLVLDSFVNYVFKRPD